MATNNTNKVRPADTAIGADDLALVARAFHQQEVSAPTTAQGARDLIAQLSDPVASADFYDATAQSIALRFAYFLMASTIDFSKLDDKGKAQIKALGAAVKSCGGKMPSDKALACLSDAFGVNVETFATAAVTLCFGERIGGKACAKITRGALNTLEALRRIAA